MLRVLFAFAFSICASSAWSLDDGRWNTKVMLKCKLKQAHEISQEWQQVDHIEVDASKHSITFAVSKTIGTSQEIYWIFSNRTDSLSRDEVIFEPDLDTLIVAAVRTKVPTTMLVTFESVRLLQLWPVSVKFIEYDCKK